MHIFSSSAVKNVSVVKNLPPNARATEEVSLISRLKRSPSGGNGNLLHYSCPGNPMDRGAWWATIHGVTRVGHDLATKEREIALVSTELLNGVSQIAPVVKNPPANAGDTSSIPMSGRFPGSAAMEGMVSHSNILARKIPWTEEPGGLQSIALQRVGHD